MHGSHRTATVLLAAAFALGACDDTGTGPLRDIVVLPGGGALVFVGDAADDPQRNRIEEIVIETVDSARQRINVANVAINVRYGTAGGLIPQFGFGGLASAGAITLTIDPASSAWPGSLEPEFARLLAHELHHVARFRGAGPSDHLLDAVVAEGLADHFMVELLGGAPPPWATAVQGAELDGWIETASQTWLEPTWDPAPWFFIGVDSEVPQWTGYSIGWELTGRYLDANPSQSASTLTSVSSTLFAPE